MAWDVIIFKRPWRYHLLLFLSPHHAPGSRFMISNDHICPYKHADFMLNDVSRLNDVVNDTRIQYRKRRSTKGIMLGVIRVIKIMESSKNQRSVAMTTTCVPPIMNCPIASRSLFTHVVSWSRWSRKYTSYWTTLVYLYVWVAMRWHNNKQNGDMEANGDG